MFVIAPLNFEEWKAVLYISAPVLLIDEILKFISVSCHQRFRVHSIRSVLTTYVYPQATYIDPPSKIEF
jgi:hypothetical protein